MKLLETYSLLFLSALTGSAHATVSVVGNEISWPDGGWYQVQSATDYSTVCEGSSNCIVSDGVYNIINLTTLQRVNNVTVGGTTNLSTAANTAEDVNTAEVVVDGNTISWPTDGWYQVQRSSDYAVVCEGGQQCVVEPGNYIVVNLTNNNRYENIVVGNVASITGESRPVINTDNYNALVTQVWEVISGQAFDQRMIDVPYFRITDNDESYSLCTNGGSHWQKVESQSYDRTHYSLDTNNCLYDFSNGGTGDIINGYHQEHVSGNRYEGPYDGTRTIGFQEFTVQLAQGGNMEVNGRMGMVNVPRSDWGRDTYTANTDLDYSFTYDGGSLRVENAITTLRRYFVTTAKFWDVVGFMQSFYICTWNLKG